MRKIRANGWEFDCALHGTRGPALVLIHGEIHSSEYWEHQIADLARDHRVLVYDRRGHAGTGAPPYGYSLVNQTRDLRALIEHFGLERPTLVAVAFGATIAANYAIEYANDVRGLAMVAWSELHDAPRYMERWAKASERVAEVLTKHGRAALLDFLRREGGRTLYMVIPLDSPIREACVRMFGQHPLEEYTRGMLEFGNSVPDLVPRFSALTVPVLGVCGEHDPFPDQPRVLAAMASFREAPAIAGASRFIQWEKPEEFNALLRGFLASLPA